MRISSAVIAFGLTLLVATSAFSQPTDFFWTFSTDNVVNQDNNLFGVYPGDKGTAYLYYTTSGPSQSELHTGAFLDIELTQQGVIEFTGARTFDFPVVIVGLDVQIANRWGKEGTGSTGTVTPNFINELGAFTIVESGIVNQNNGKGLPFLDTGYNAQADAFLFASVDFDIVGCGSTEIRASVGSGLVVDNEDFNCTGVSIEPTFGIAGIGTPLGPMGGDEPQAGGREGIPDGDINGDGVTDLLDVQPFVNLLANMQFNFNADINQDGIVNLLDVDGFIALLTGICDADPGLPQVGDANCDGCINLLDVPCFLRTLVDSSELPCDFETVDINGDGSVDLLDVAPLVFILLNQE